MVRRQKRPKAQRPSSKRAILIGGGLLGAFLLWNVLGPYGFVRYYQVKLHLRELSDQVINLRKDCQELKHRIALLKNNRAYIEKVARQRYGLIKDNEILYQFPRD
ncbi:FtsB family cell division protein [Thermosulfuriphilus sp.]